MNHFVALLFLPTLALAAEVFDGYETYYSSLPNRLFQSSGVGLEPFSLGGARHPICLAGYGSG